MFVRSAKMKQSILYGHLLISAVVLAVQNYSKLQNICSTRAIIHPECAASDSRGRNFISPSSLELEFLTESSKSQHECLTIQNKTQSFCVYSFPSFADGRGLSIITTPDRMKSIRLLSAFTNKGILSGTNKQPSPLYTEIQLPGRGRGLIANKTLHRGDQIFAHTPVLILDADTTYLSESELVKLENAAVNKLPGETKELFWNLYGQPGVDPAKDRIDTNSFEIEVGNFAHSAVFPEISLLNHDCRPNAAYFFDQQSLTQYVHAITTITPGTEITITYIDPHTPRRERLIQLATWGFHCSCSLCVMSTSLSRASDMRLAQIEALTNHLEDWQTASPQMAQALVSLYKQERLYASLSDAYQLAALAFCEEGHRWSAIQYALLAIEFGLLYDGFESKDVDLMVLLAEQPEEQPCWLQRVKHGKTSSAESVQNVEDIHSLTS